MGLTVIFTSVDFLICIRVLSQNANNKELN
jgi:hypothetical protein